MKLKFSCVTLWLVLFLATPLSLKAFYDPSLQRWINRDPIGEMGGINVFAVNGNNPVNLVDLFGLEILRGSVCEADYQKAKEYVSKSHTAKEFLDKHEGKTGKILTVERIDTGHSETKGRNVKWDPTAAQRTHGGATQSPALTLLHELMHAALDGSSLEQDEEVNKFVNKCAEELGDEGLRKYHDDWERAFRVKDVTQNKPVGPAIRVPLPDVLPDPSKMLFPGRTPTNQRPPTNRPFQWPTNGPQVPSVPRRTN